MQRDVVPPNTFVTEIDLHNAVGSSTRIRRFEGRLHPLPICPFKVSISLSNAIGLKGFV